MLKRFKMKIRAGETFLYRKGGTESQVFEIRMKSDISSYHMERAAKLAYRRYPYLKSLFKTIDGNIYYAVISLCGKVHWSQETCMRNSITRMLRGFFEKSLEE